MSLSSVSLACSTDFSQIKSNQVCCYIHILIAYPDEVSSNAVIFVSHKHRDVVEKYLLFARRGGLNVKLHQSTSQKRQQGAVTSFFLEGGRGGGVTSLPVSHITSCFAADAPSGRVYFINGSMTYNDFRRIL